MSETKVAPIPVSVEGIERVFITGGSGFLGRTLIEQLVLAGVRDIRALVRSEAAEALVPNLPGVSKVKGDLFTLEAVRNAMTDCTHVFHFAANVSPWGPYEVSYRDNVVGTQNMVNCARAAGVKRFVHCSTEALLVGQSKKIVNADETWPIPNNPKWCPYSRSKAEAEQFVIAANSPDMATVAIRPRYIWGRGDTVVLARIAKAVRDGAFAWFDNGKYDTSTCHVRNVCEGAILAATKGRGGEVYFLTDGAPHELREWFTVQLATCGITKLPTRNVSYGMLWYVAILLELIWWIAGLTIGRFRPITSEPPISRQILRLMGRTVTVNDKKARDQLGYRAHVTTEVGLQEQRDDYAKSKAAPAKK